MSNEVVMLRATRSFLKESVLIQRAYRRYIQNYLPRFEPEEYLIERIHFDLCVDVGANVGTYSALLSRNSTLVYAFEPVQRSFRILKGLNIRNVVAYNVALGNQSGEVDIALPTFNGKVDYYLPTLRSIPQNVPLKIERQKVRVIKFDDLETKVDFPRIDFVKIDVEGFEMQVLFGMQRLLELRKAAFMIEIERRHNPEYMKVFKHLGRLGYAPYITEDGVSLRKLDALMLPKLQSDESFAQDMPRKVRRGERKGYINNIFFLQAGHTHQYPIV
jgi:FkbM family methyltransferase